MLHAQTRQLQQPLPSSPVHPCLSLLHPLPSPPFPPPSACLLLLIGWQADSLHAPGLILLMDCQLPLRLAGCKRNVPPTAVPPCSKPFPAPSSPMPQWLPQTPHSKLTLTLHVQFVSLVAVVVFCSFILFLFFFASFSSSSFFSAKLVIVGCRVVVAVVVFATATATAFDPRSVSWRQRLCLFIICLLLAFFRLLVVVALLFLFLPLSLSLSFSVSFSVSLSLLLLARCSDFRVAHYFSTVKTYLQATLILKVWP